VLNVAWRWKVAGVEAGRGKPRLYAENLWSAFFSISASARQGKRVSAGVMGLVRGTKKDTRARALRDGGSITDAPEASTKAPALESGRYVLGSGAL
jgi:hypothetical protein